MEYNPCSLHEINCCSAINLISAPRDNGPVPKVKKTMAFLKEAGVQYITNEAGDRTAVILPIEAFQELLQDLEDLATIADRRGEPSITHRDLVYQLERDGILRD